jgi:hypothetical protein
MEEPLIYTPPAEKTTVRNSFSDRAAHRRGAGTRQVQSGLS